MKWIDYEAPKSLGEALNLLSQHGDRARPMAGGTDILVQLRAGARDPDLLVDVKGIPELNGYRTGDQIVRTVVWTPKKLNKHEEGLFKELAEMENIQPPSVGKRFFERMKEAFGGG